MAPRKTVKRRRVIRRKAPMRRRRIVKRKGQRSMVMVNRMPRSLGYPWPPRYRTSLLLDRTFDIIAGATTPNGYFDLQANSLWGRDNAHGPFDSNNIGFANAGDVTQATMTGVAGRYVDNAYSAVGVLVALPAGLAQLATLYNRYRVYACSVLLSAFNANESFPLAIGGVPWHITNFASGNSAPPTTLDQLIQLPRAKWQMVQQYSGNKRNNSVKFYCSTAEATGTHKRAVQDDQVDFSADVGHRVGQAGASQVAAGQGQNWLWRFIWANSTAAATVSQTTYNMKIRYYVELFRDPTAGISQSTSDFVATDLYDAGGPVGPGFGSGTTPTGPSGPTGSSG